MTLERVEFGGGMNVYIDPMPHAHTNSLWAVIGYGSVYERPGEEGAAHALEHAVHGQTEGFQNQRALDEFARSYGAQTNAFTGSMSTYYMIERSNDVDAGMYYLGQILMRPTFAPNVIDHEMQAVRYEAKTKLEDWPRLHLAAANYAMFGAPAGRQVLGHADRLDFDAATLRSVYERNYGWGNMALLAAGNVTSEEVIGGMEAHFENKFPDAQPDQPQLQLPYSGPRTTGLVNGGSKRLRVMHSIPLDEQMRNAYRDDELAFDIATNALEHAYFSVMRYEKAVTHQADFGFQTYNHPDCWIVQAETLIDANKLPLARSIVKALFETGSAAVSDEALAAAHATTKARLAEELDVPQKRVMDHRQRFAMGAEPQDLEKRLAMVSQLSLEEVRASLDTICQYATSKPHFEHFTGTREDIGEVDHIIERSQIA